MENQDRISVFDRDLIVSHIHLGPLDILLDFVHLTECKMLLKALNSGQGINVEF